MGLLSGSCCWGAVVEKLSLGSCCWRAVVRELVLGSCCWGAVVGELSLGSWEKGAGMLVQDCLVHDAFAMYFWMVIRYPDLRCA